MNARSSDVRIASETGLLTIDVLGPMRARSGGRELALGSPQQRAVLAALALRANHVVSRDELIDSVWGEKLPASVQGVLYTLVSRLRHILDPGSVRGKGTGQRLVSTGAGYLLKLTEHGCDAFVFEDLRARAAARLASGDVRGQVKLLDEALELWRGGALTGVPGPFAEGQRRRLAELRLATIERRAEANLVLGRHADLTVELGELSREHPTRESLRRLQMLALYRAGRAADALEVYRDARRLLTSEIGIDPGPELQRLHQQILDNDPSLHSPATTLVAALEIAPSAQPARLSVIPPGVRRSWDTVPATLIGRDDELRVVRQLVEELLRGRGRTLWIEGEPGIGKSTLLNSAFAGVQEQGCQLAWAVADELAQNFPLHVIRECLPAQATSARAQTSAPEGQPALEEPGWDPRELTNPTLAALDQLVARVEEFCAVAPLVLVVDDLQWADDTSLLMWHRLGGLVHRLPLLLVSASRPDRLRPALSQLHSALESRGAVVLALPALTPLQTQSLMKLALGVPPGPALTRLADRAAGNPLFLREMLDAISVAGHLTVSDGVAEFDDAARYDAPASLLSAVTSRMAALSAEANRVLRIAAILGVEFEVADVAIALRRPASSLVEVIDEAVASNVLVDDGLRLAFRHPLLRQALYEAMPASMRIALHREMAEVLSAAGAPVDKVARLLSAVGVGIGPWMLGWLRDNEAELIMRVPALALDLLKNAASSVDARDPRWEELTAAYASALFRLGENPEPPATAVLAHTTDPQRMAEMRYLLASVRYRQGRADLAVEMLREAIDDPFTPVVWRARLSALEAGYLCAGVEDLDAAEASALAAIELASKTRDALAGADARQTLWHINAIRRDHEAALHHLDEAFDVVRDIPELLDLRLNLLDSRMFTLQNLDRLAEVDGVLAAARELTARHGLPAALEIPAAVHCYWTGRWSEALSLLAGVVEEEPVTTYGGFRERTAAMLLTHGVAALINLHQDRAAAARSHLDAVASYTLSMGADRANCDFLLMAQAVAAEQQGRLDDALAAMEPILNPGYAPMMLRHQWLPDYVRMALAMGATALARTAADVCAAEARRERIPARATAADQRCVGLLTLDAALLLQAADHYRKVGRVVELAQTLDEAAVSLGPDDPDRARAAFDEARSVYTSLDARWDLSRLTARMAEFGIEAKIEQACRR
jgi:DNA-binding SARP family transcriptional activator